MQHKHTHIHTTTRAHTNARTHSHDRTNRCCWWMIHTCIHTYAHKHMLVAYKLVRVCECVQTSRAYTHTRTHLCSIQRVSVCVCLTLYVCRNMPAFRMCILVRVCIIADELAQHIFEVYIHTAFCVCVFACARVGKFISRFNHVHPTHTQTTLARSRQHTEAAAAYRGGMRDSHL